MSKTIKQPDSSNLKSIKQLDLSSLADNWTSSIVAREEVQNFTGGIITSKTIANLDCQGKGPEGRIRVGRKIAYPVNLFIQWLEQRAEIVA